MRRRRSLADAALHCEAGRHAYHVRGNELLNVHGAVVRNAERVITLSNLLLSMGLESLNVELVAGIRDRAWQDIENARRNIDHVLAQLPPAGQV
jgi:hypothetical protein